MKKFAISLFLVGCINYSWAQKFEYMSKIDSIPQSGFYKVLLSPEIISVSKLDYSDIRLYDAKHKEVPYILELELPATERTGFKEYEVLENRYIPKQAITRIIVENSAKTSISSLNLIVRNSRIEKEITLKGSDDQKNWYIISKSFPEVISINFGETSKVMALDFPKSNYRFLELTMNDKKKDPIRVIKVGYFDYEVAKGLYTEIPSPTIKQKDSAKHSYVSVKFDRTYEISKLEFQFKGPEFYLRDCSIGRYVTYNKKVVFEEIGHFTASSKSTPIWELYNVKADELTIIINNSDNTPLQLTSIKAFQLNKYLVAKLNQGETYQLFTCQKNLVAPEYDLKYFKDSLPSTIAIVKTGGLINIGKQSGSEKPAFFNNTVLWIVISIVIVLLAWLSIKLVKEMGNKSD